ncbi:MAG: PH domain-containing protein [Flavobacteriaceae bacterium]
MDNFSEFSRQSPKGIVVIYGRLMVRLFKATWVLFFLFFTQWFSKLSGRELLYVFLGFGFVLLFLLVRAYLIYRNYQFKIEGDYFILKQGILSKSNTSISFDRVQNINFKQNLIQQAINVYGVSIETAGSKKTEIYIKALSHEKAKALKNKISTNKNTLEAVPKKEKIKPLLSINIKELFKVSLTENHLQSLLLFLALLFGFYQQIEQLLDSLGQKEFLKEYLSESSDAVFGSIMLIVIFLFILTIIAIISSFVRVFLFHFNLTLFAKKEAFEINQGLLTKKSIVLKKQKVQSIVVSTNPLKRRIGISYITFKQAVSGKTKKNKDKLIRVVGCKENQSLKVKEHLFNIEELENNEKLYPTSYYKGRMLFQSFLLLIVLNTILYLVFQGLNIFYANIGLVPLFYFLVHKKYKKRFYKLTDNMLLVGKGLVETHRTYFELFKVQSVKMKQTIFQQRKNVVDIVLQTASGKIRIPCIEVKKANHMYNYLLYTVETSTEPWM